MNPIRVTIAKCPNRPGFTASELVGAVIGLMLIGWLLRGASETAALRKNVVT
jgi:hypothetical protein